MSAIIVVSPVWVAVTVMLLLFVAGGAGSPDFSINLLTNPFRLLPAL
ncbi:MAG: hypothetical protein IT516_15735 [Burkholderiales bacterium]|nr:hypothetical protein [Burkholderiales bacterium]